MIKIFLNNEETLEIRLANNRLEANLAYEYYSHLYLKDGWTLKIKNKDDILRFKSWDINSIQLIDASEKYH